MKLTKRVSDIAESVTLAITSKAKKMVKEGIDVVSFAAGEPDFDTPMHIKEAGIEAIKSGFTKYTPSSGTLELREAIAGKFKKDNALDYSPAQIVVSNGAKHSLNNIFQALCEEGDEVLIPSPYWLSYPAMVNMSEAAPVFIGTSAGNNFKITEKDLAAKITKKTKCFVLNSPSNPAGSVYSADEMKAIAGLAVKHGFYVISDEIYEKLIYGGAKHVSIASLGREIYERTITVNGLSKSYSMTGWRIGYAAGPLEIMKAIANLQSHAASNPSSISQKAATAAIAGDQRCVAEMKREFEKRRDLMVSGISGMKNIACIKPEGAFYVLCDISKLKMSSVEAANKLLDEARVAVIPGMPFGDDSVIRLSFATGTAQIEKGMDRIKEWVSKNG
ncbi:MAG: pyridoxal phosphate-dependent aminotransferase [Candidatus Omnitrophica bacterium]|nr:pyridoxal phosphate-dependent aminotransferase [Candidatus Omnitrophota bacterium]MDD5436544.1 pyridoxal phosphate-dependent aminotransferase [Candidatus Omnitrophota bacterium]